MSERSRQELLMQRTRPSAVPVEYDRAAAGMPPGGGGAATSVFPVKVQQTGGSSGNKTAQCSYTYTVKTLAGETMAKNAAGDPAENMSPAKTRPSIGKMAAPPANSYGLAFWDGTDLVLYDANETLAPQACS